MNEADVQIPTWLDLVECAPLIGFRLAPGPHFFDGLARADAVISSWQEAGRYVQPLSKADVMRFGARTELFEVLFYPGGINVQMHEPPEDAEERQFSRLLSRCQEITSEVLEVVTPRFPVRCDRVGVQVKLAVRRENIPPGGMHDIFKALQGINAFTVFPGYLKLHTIQSISKDEERLVQCHYQILSDPEGLPDFIFMMLDWQQVWTAPKLWDGVSWKKDGRRDFTVAVDSALNHFKSVEYGLSN